jgi:hypothetical protein
MPVTHDRETQAKLRLAARSYRKALAKHAARPSATRAAKVAARQAELTVLLERSHDVEDVAA